MGFGIQVSGSGFREPPEGAAEPKAAAEKALSPGVVEGVVEGAVPNEKPPPAGFGIQFRI